MQIYLWTRSPKHAGYLGASESDEKQMQWYDPRMGDPLPPVPKWKVPHLIQYLGDKKAKKPAPIGDAPMSGLVNLISDRAAHELGDIWERHATLYPVELADDPGKRYFMVVARTVLDCLDKTRSSGKPPMIARDKRDFALLERWVFNETCVGENDLFVMPHESTSLYVSARFWDRVSKAGLKGFCLKHHFWDDKPLIS